MFILHESDIGGMTNKRLLHRLVRFSLYDNADADGYRAYASK
jgi:hypothetical protein